MVDDFYKTKFTYAMVVRAGIEDIQALQEFIDKNDFVICYQKTSTNKLFIKEGGE